MIVRSLVPGLAALTLAATATPVSAQEASIVGRWRTTAENGVVEIQRCGTSYCGQLVDAAPLRRNPDQKDVRNHNQRLRDRPLQGLAVLRNFSGGPTVWNGGPLYDPNSGQNAGSGTLTLVNANRLSVRGCIAPLLCRTQTWTRVQ